MRRALAVTVAALTLTAAPLTAHATDPAPEPPRSTGAYIYLKLEPAAGPAWTNSGPQRFLLAWDGHTYRTALDPTLLPADVCGPGWAVQQDQINGGVGDFPGTITYPTSGFPAGVYVTGRHWDLDALTTVPACAEPEPTPTPEPTPEPTPREPPVVVPPVTPEPPVVEPPAVAPPVVEPPAVTPPVVEAVETPAQAAAPVPTLAETGTGDAIVYGLIALGLAGAGAAMKHGADRKREGSR